MDPDTERAALLALSRLRGVGARGVALLVTHFGSASAACQALHSERAQVVRRAIGGRPDVDGAAADLASWSAAGVRTVGVGEAFYPPALAAIYDPPPLLYVRGDVAVLHERCLAVVGTRRCSDHGRAFASKLASELALSGVVVVSGLAFGIDAAAHRGALTGGRTAAILAGSPSEVAPARHRPLAAEIVKGGGAVLGELPPGERVSPGRFVARNRIVSGLCSGVIVVEAAEHSGALHTSDFALEQGRTVMAVPGRPGDRASVGALALIRDGAVPVATAEQALEAVGWDAAVQPAAPKVASGADAELIAALDRHGPLTLDALALALARTPADLRGALGRLELAGSVRRTPDGRYASA